MIKKLLVLVLMVVVSACVAGPTPQTSQPKLPLQIGYNPWPYSALFIANEMGFFKQEGVEVKLVRYDDMDALYTAIATKKSDASIGLVSDIVAQAEGGVKTQAVWMFDESAGSDVVVGNGKLTRPTDLKGQRVGVGMGTFSQIFVLAGLAKYGLKPEDVTLVNIKEDRVPAEIAAGTIAAGHTWEPFLSQALKNGGKPLFTSADTPGVIADVLLFRQDVIEQRPDDVKAVVRALAAALKFWQENPEKGNEIVARLSEIPPTDIAGVLAGLKTISPADNRAAFGLDGGEGKLEQIIRLTSDLMLQSKVIKQPVDPKTVLNPSFVQALPAN